MRGIFSAGVLDAFLERDFHPFDLAFGVSVGAANLLSYLARQHGRTRRCFVDQMSRPEFIDPWRMLRGGHCMDLDWLWDAIEREDPLDRVAAARSGVEYGLVATCARSGRPHYLTPAADDMLDAIKASCALPVLYRATVSYRGNQFVDGGLSDPLPVREAYLRGARVVVVVRSRAARFVKKTKLSNHFAGWLLRAEDRPGAARACRSAARAYQEAVAFLTAPPSDCAIVHVAPDVPLATRRTTRARAALDADYELGRALGQAAIERYEALVGARTAHRETLTAAPQCRATMNATA